MNAVGKVISVVIYAAALYITHQYAPGSVMTVAIVGVVLFFVIHLGLRMKQRTSK